MYFICMLMEVKYNKGRGEKETEKKAKKNVNKKDAEKRRSMCI